MAITCKIHKLIENYELILYMNFLEYSTAQNKAPVAGKVLIIVGNSPLYRAKIPSFLAICKPARNIGSEIPETYQKKNCQSDNSI